MKRILLNSFGKSILCLLVALLSGGSAWATEDVYKTALFGQDYSSRQVNSYTASWTSTYDGLTLNIENLKNSGSDGWYNYISTGEPNRRIEATITTATSLPKAITKVVVTFDKLTAANVSSIKLSTSTNGTDWTEAGEFERLKGAQAVSLSTPTENLYYQVTANCLEGGTGNYNFVKISKIEFYYDDPYLTAAPVVTCSSANTPKFNSETTVTITCPDATIQYSIDGGNQWRNYSAPFTINETKTIKAKALGNGEGMRESYLVSTTFVNEVDMKDVTWDLTTNSYSESDANLVTWEVDYATMTIDKGTSSSNANAYLGGSNRRTHTELYKNQILTIAPTDDYIITSVEITSTSGHVDGLNDRAWENATAVTNGNVVTITPNDGTLPFHTGISTDGTVIVNVKVYYAPASSPFITAANAETVSGANQNGTVNIVYNRINKTDIVSETVVLCDAAGNASEYDWISFNGNGFDSDKNVSYSTTANASATARTAYLKINAEATINGVQKAFESPVFSVTQKAAFVVNITSVGYRTYVAPANVSFPEVTAFTVTATTETTVKMEEVEAVPEGTGLVLKGEGDYFVLEEATAPEPVYNLLIVSDGTVIGGSGAYALSNKSKGVGFYPVKDGVTVPAGIPYLQISNEAKSFYGFEEDDATGIDSVASDSSVTSANIYNVAGQRLQKMQKGINIINGKKILK